MNKILEFTKKYGMLITITLLLIITFRGCGVNGDREFEHNKLSGKIDSIETVVNSIPKEVLTKDDVQSLFDESMWEYLELEELGDKKGITITELKHMDDKKRNKLKD